MNLKHKIVRAREGEQPNNRYNTQASVYESTPALPRGWNTLRINKDHHQNKDALHLNKEALHQNKEALHQNKDALHLNKENQQNAHNYQLTTREEPRYGQFQGIRSLEIPKRLRTSANQSEFCQFKKHKLNLHQEELRSSDQFVRFREKQTTEPHEEAAFYRGEYLTFGEVGRSGMLTSRQFLEQKRMKNEAIDEIMINAKRGLCKSVNEFSSGAGHCVNHPGKKVKYRLVAELSEGEEEVFYCSKCAINLLQQNFKIVELRGDEGESRSNSLRLQQITKFQARLKGLEEMARLQSSKNHVKEETDLIEQQIVSSSNRFEDMMEMLQRMRKEWISSLNSLRLKILNEEKARQDDLHDMLANMRDIQQEIKEYKNLKKFAVMKENEFQFITASLDNKLTKFEENMHKANIQSPSQRLSATSLNYLQIVDKLKEELAVVKDRVRERREREVTFSRKTEPRERLSEDEFVCDELKRPFRVLFPTDDCEQVMEGPEKSKMLSSVVERSGYDRRI